MAPGEGQDPVTLDEVLAAYLARLDAGESVSLDDLCNQHPSLEVDLRRVVPVLDSLKSRPATETLSVSTSEGPHGVEEDAPGARYEIEASIGRGGMGEVMRVFDRDMRRHLALKRSLAPPPDHGPEAREAWLRFMGEARLAGRLEHPGIVPVHELGIGEEGRPYFTMRLVRGRELGEVFAEVKADEGASVRASTLRILQQVCDAVAYAHDQGVIHRDLKPSNVMVGTFGEVYVMDWGLARGLKEEPRLGGREDEETAPTQTREGRVLGTPCYMAPEQARGEPLDARTDVYAVGAMLYELLVGHPPHLEPGEGRSSEAVLDRLRAGPPNALPRTVPGELTAICERAMARSVDARYALMRDLAADLGAYLEHQVVRAYRTGPLVELSKWTRRNRNTALALLFAVLALVAGLVGSLLLYSRAEEARVLAENERASVLRLSLMQDLEQLTARADALWPVTPDSVEPLEEWLGDLNTLRAETPNCLEALEQFESRSDTERSEARSKEWWIRNMTQFLDQVEQVSDEQSGVAGVGITADRGAGVRARLELARRLRAQSDGGWRARREQAARTLDRVLPDRDPQAFADLVPIGDDVESGLLEFWHVPSGSEPLRDEQGYLQMTGDSGIVLVLVPDLRGLVGSQSSDPTGPHFDPRADTAESPPREVLAGAILVSKFEVTQGQWLRATGSNPSEFSPESAGVDLSHPVEGVTFLRCEEVSRWWGLTIPNQEVWELAARAGSGRPFYWPEGASPADFANLADQAMGGSGTDPWNDGAAHHAPVGSYLPNAFGLHDVHGNVEEWRRSGGGSSTAYGGGGQFTTLVFSRVSWFVEQTADHGFVDRGVRPVRPALQAER